MNLYQLQYFVKLAHLQHYTKAAKELSITQPSLSHAMNTLEQELGVKLFQKEGRNVVLTQYGKQYLKDIEDILNHLSQSTRQMQRIGQGHGCIRLSFLRSIGVHYIPQILRAFQKAYPDKDITFELNNDSGLSKDLIDGLKQQKYDIVFCSLPHEDETLIYEPIIKQELFVAVEKNHPLAKRKSVQLSDIIHENFIHFSKKSGLRHEIDQLFAYDHIYPQNIVYEISEDEVIASFVEHGFGIAILPHIKIVEQMDVTLIPIDHPFNYRNLYMVMNKDVYHAPILIHFYEFIKTQYKKTGD